MRVALSPVELTDGLDELVSTVGDDRLTAQEIFLDLRGLEEAAGDREDHPDSTVGRIEPIVHRERLRLDPAPGEHVSEFGESKDRFELVVEEVDGGSFLGHTGTDEDRLEVLAQFEAQHPGHRHHGGDDGRQIGHQVRVVLANVRDHRRAGRGDVAHVRILFQQAAVGPPHQVGPQGDLVDRIETEGSDHGHQSTRRHLPELRGETGGHEGCHPGARRQ